MGKARSLKNRVSSYFANPERLHERTRQMMENAVRVEWIQVNTELDALLLEHSLIKAHKPKYNVLLKDDKTYPYIALSFAQEWPRAYLTRAGKSKGVMLFGPFVQPRAVRESLELLQKTFPLRSCSDKKLERHTKEGRPCLLFHIARCCGPCIGAVDRPDYENYVEDTIAVLSGNTKEVANRAKAEMALASKRLDFERAAIWRDRIEDLKVLAEKQQMVGDQSEEFDAVGIFDRELVATVQIIQVRSGTIVGQIPYTVEKVEALNYSQLVAKVLEWAYDDQAKTPPKEILVPTKPENMEVLGEWLQKIKGSKVSIKVPMKGKKKSLIDLACKNAEDESNRQNLRRSSDHVARARAIEELADVLKLPKLPYRIECYDCSHLQGTNYVGSMVVFEDGLPKRSLYRRFKINTGHNDDYLAMREMLARRLKRIKEATEFGKTPDLIVLDGGKGQLGVGVELLKEMNLEKLIPIVSLAKKFEEVFVPGQKEGILIPRDRESLYLLERLRDEAHRFAITFHRELRQKNFKTSVLDGIPGLGDKRKAKLLKEMGGIGKVKEADLNDLKKLTWLPSATSEAIYSKIHNRNQE